MTHPLDEMVAITEALGLYDGPPGTPVDVVVIKQHKPHWLQVWTNGIWTDRVVCSTCGIEKKMNSASVQHPDPAHATEEA